MTDVRPLTHKFTIEPVTEARMKMLQARSHPGAYETEAVPPNILAQVREIARTETMVRLKGPHEVIWMPLPVPRPNWFGLSRGYCDHLLAKYNYPGFVSVEKGDVVVDCGSFVGGFALAAAELASRVVALEPAPVSFACLKRNAIGSSIEPLQLGLFDQNQTIRFYLHGNPTDNSILDDADTDAAATDVEVITLDSLRERTGIDRIDFLKLEAEGVELEVLSHVRPETVRKIAIDAGPERHGQSPFLDIAVLLASRGYKLANRNYWLYAHA